MKEGKRARNLVCQTPKGVVMHFKRTNIQYSDKDENVLRVSPVCTELGRQCTEYLSPSQFTFGDEDNI